MSDEKVQPLIFGSERFVRTADLRVGDTIVVWWRPNRDTITALRPYKGPLECMRGGVLIDFAILRTGMSAAPGDVHEVVARSGA